MNANNVLLGAGVGLALAFMLDPSQGRRRRALAGARMRSATRKTRDALDATARDMANRTRGIAAATSRRFTDDAADDDTLVERVRAKLGRVCSHPRAIDVESVNGAVTLRGPVLAEELNGLLSVVAAVRGVQSVNNELESHESAEGVPSLQGIGNVAPSRLDLFQRNWAPATQALVAAAGLATGVCMAAYARR
ncbi:MAG: BON domain-containing protein [Vicinamibacterales bacterium]